MEQIIKKQHIVDFFLKHNILVSSDLLESFDWQDLETAHTLIQKKIRSNNFMFFNRDLSEALKNASVFDINWQDLERSKVQQEKGRDSKVYAQFLSYLLAKKPEVKKEEKVKIIFSYSKEPKKRDTQDFVQYFNNRYKSIERILMSRPELKHITSISRVINKKDREEISIIGIIKEKSETKNGNLMLTLEDPTGEINVLVNKNKPEIYNDAKSIVYDEVIGVSGVNGKKILFANQVIWPDVSFRELKKSPDEGYALFLSDMHVGSKNFLPDAFNKFLRWLNQETGSDKQKSIASKVKYIFIIGDIIDGCGIYPEQDNELDIKDVYRQYEACADLLSKIPKHIPIIICPGNHDAMRIAEPQPPLYKDFAKPIYELPNVICVSNPAIINIDSSEDFSGFDILLYHGYSFDYFVANVDSIRNNGGYDKGNLIMKFLLKRRHLAPSHSSTLYIPDVSDDPLFINKIPDFFATGHIHKSVAVNYKNITLISGSCWQSKTAFQEKVGHNPEPGRVPLVNLQTREIKILNFL